MGHIGKLARMPMLCTAVGTINKTENENVDATLRFRFKCFSSVCVCASVCFSNHRKYRWFHLVFTDFWLFNRRRWLLELAHHCHRCERPEELDDMTVTKMKHIVLVQTQVWINWLALAATFMLHNHWLILSCVAISWLVTPGHIHAGVQLDTSNLLICSCQHCSPNFLLVCYIFGIVDLTKT